MSTDWSSVQNKLTGKETRRVAYQSVPALGLKILVRQFAEIPDDQQQLALDCLDMFIDTTAGVTTQATSISNPRAGRKSYPGVWYLKDNKAGPVKGVVDTPGIVQTLFQYTDDYVYPASINSNEATVEEVKAFPTRALAQAWLASQVVSTTGEQIQAQLQQAEPGWVVHFNAVSAIPTPNAEQAVTATGSELETVQVDQNQTTPATLPGSAPDGQVVTVSRTKTAFPGIYVNRSSVRQAILRSYTFTYPSMWDSTCPNQVTIVEGIAPDDLQAILSDLSLCPYLITDAGGNWHHVDYSLRPHIESYTNRVGAQIHRTVGHIVPLTDDWLNYESLNHLSWDEEHNANRTKVRRREIFTSIKQTRDRGIAYAFAYTITGDDGTYFISPKSGVEYKGQGRYRAVGIAIAKKWGAWEDAQ